MTSLQNKIKELEDKGLYEEGIIFLKKELKKDPRNLKIQTELGNFYALSDDYEEALGYFRRVHHVYRDNELIIESICFCLNYIGNEYHKKRQFKQAALYFEELASHTPNNWHYYYNYANTLQDMDKYPEAIKQYLAAIRFGGSKDKDLFNNLGNTYQKINNLTEAKECFEKSLSLEMTDKTLIQLVHLNQKLNDWSDFNKHLDLILNRLKTENFSFPPFPLLSLPKISNKDYLNIANHWNSKDNMHFEIADRPKNKNDKIKIAYMSSDFRNHPLYHLVYDCLNSHDKNKFEVNLYFNGFYEDSTESKNFKKLGSHFVNTFEMSDHQLINDLIEKNIDILIDLSGFTKNSRSSILKYHPVPIQVNWLGYPGTLGFDNGKALCDYIFADKHIIPKESYENFAEKVINLSPTYQPNNLNRPLIKSQKGDYNLPEREFIWGSFNQNLKITQEIFNAWLDILKACPESSLWLLNSNENSIKNIKKYLSEKEISTTRVIFADYIGIAEHMGRLSHVDLFLDCYPYNAHTTTADAIYVNKPTLTIEGDLMQSRVASSLIKTVDCYEDLVAKNIKEYKLMAIDFYKNQKKLKEINIKIESNKDKIFEPGDYTKQLEDIYSRLISSN